MLRAFRWNLRVLSYISLVVGAFLIYNTISVSVVRRRPEIGILRALGAGRAARPLAVPGRSAAVRPGRLGAGHRAGTHAGRGDGGADRADRERALHQQPAGGDRARRRGDRRRASSPGLRWRSALGVRAGARGHAGGAHRSHEPRRARASRAPALGARSGLGRRASARWRSSPRRPGRGRQSRVAATSPRCWPSCAAAHGRSGRGAGGESADTPAAPRGSSAPKACWPAAA